MMSVCRNNSVSSFFGFPPPPLEEDHHFSQASYPTLGALSPPAPLTPPPPPPNDLFHDFHNHPFQPITVLDSSLTLSPAHIDLMACTESLGFESYDEIMSTFEDLGRSVSGSSDQESSPSSSSSPVEGCMRRREKGVAKGWEERMFPPPLTSLSENGRRNFVLKSTRKEGRLEIVGVMIDHPEILCATRDNGRLRMHLVKSQYDDDDDDEEEEEEERAEEEEEEEETERRRPAAVGMRRCYHHQRYMQVWGSQQHHRYVTTI